MTAVNEAAFLPHSDIRPLDNDGIVAGGGGIARGLLTSGTLGSHSREVSLAGLTRNRTILDQAIGNAAFCAAARLRRGGVQFWTKPRDALRGLVASKSALLAQSQPVGATP